MQRTFLLITASFSLTAMNAQVHFGAAVGWSHSRAIGQGGPGVGVLCEFKHDRSTTRAILEAQLPTTRYTTVENEGIVRSLTANAWIEGHSYRLVSSDAMSMLTVGVERLFTIDEDEPKDRLDLRLGPGLRYATEQLRYDQRIDDLTADSTWYISDSRVRRTASLTAALGAAYRLPFGTLVVEACTELLTGAFDNVVGGSAWFQRQTFRVGAIFPLADRSKAQSAPPERSAL